MQCRFREIIVNSDTAAQLYDRVLKYLQWRFLRRYCKSSLLATSPSDSSLNALRKIRFRATARFLVLCLHLYSHGNMTELAVCAVLLRLPLLLLGKRSFKVSCLKIFAFFLHVFSHTFKYPMWKLRPRETFRSHNFNDTWFASSIKKSTMLKFYN